MPEDPPAMLVGFLLYPRLVRTSDDDDLIIETS